MARGAGEGREGGEGEGAGRAGGGKGACGSPLFFLGSSRRLDPTRPFLALF